MIKNEEIRQEIYEIVIQNSNLRNQILLQLLPQLKEKDLEALFDVANKELDSRINGLVEKNLGRVEVQSKQEEQSSEKSWELTPEELKNINAEAAIRTKEENDSNKPKKDLHIELY